MQDSVMAEIPTLQTSKFMMSDPKNFVFIGLIPEEILENVPLDNAIVRVYHKLPSFGVRPMPADIRQLIDESNKMKRGGKRKANVDPYESVKAPKKMRKPAKKPRSPSLIIQEDSEERTVTKGQEDNTLRNEEEDTAATSERIPTETISKVSSSTPSSIHSSDTFNTILQESILNLTTTPPPTLVTPPTSPITSKIPISSIPPLPPMSSVGISLPQISIPLSSPIFTDSTTPTTSSVSTPLEVPVIKSVSEEIQTSCIHVIYLIRR